MKKFLYLLLIPLALLSCKSEDEPEDTISNIPEATIMFVNRSDYFANVYIDNVFIHGIHGKKNYKHSLGRIESNLSVYITVKLYKYTDSSKQYVSNTVYSTHNIAADVPCGKNSFCEFNETAYHAYYYNE